MDMHAKINQCSLLNKSMFVIFTICAGTQGPRCLAADGDVLRLTSLLHRRDHVGFVVRIAQNNGTGMLS
jgi:hypothetical protein